MTVSPILLSPEETAALLGISRQQVYRLLNDNKLDGGKVGRSTRISRESVDAYVAKVLDDSVDTGKAPATPRKPANSQPSTTG